MAMTSAPSRAQAIHAMQLPPPLYFDTAGLPPRFRAEELLLVESDGEWWFNPDTVEKQLKIAGLTEEQLNVKLTTGHTHCPKCNHDLAAPSAIGNDLRVGFYDYFVDNVRIQEQFSCKKCRHQWGGKCSGPKDFTLTPVVASSPRAATARGTFKPPAGGSVTGRVWAIADAIYATNPADWKTVRAALVVAGEAEGIHSATVATQAAKWRKARGVA